MWGPEYSLRGSGTPPIRSDGVGPASWASAQALGPGTWPRGDAAWLTATSSGAARRGCRRFSSGDFLESELATQACPPVLVCAPAGQFVARGQEAALPFLHPGHQRTGAGGGRVGGRGSPRGSGHVDLLHLLHWVRTRPRSWPAPELPGPAGAWAVLACAPAGHQERGDVSNSA